MNAISPGFGNLPIGVVGAGLAGLAAACTLAARGHKVVLFDKNPWLGGKAAQLQQDGFRFDMGPTILTVPEVLARHARHVSTGAPLDSAAVARIVAADKADAGFATVEYLESALVDLAFHSGPPPADPIARQAQVLAALDAPAAIPMRHATPHFQHVFAGDGYAAGYYAYIWSEVLDADSVKWFEENGGLKRENGDHFRKTLLSQGGAKDAMALYRDFRGRDPEVDPLLVRRGLKSSDDSAAPPSDEAVGSTDPAAKR